MQCPVSFTKAEKPKTEFSGSGGSGGTPGWAGGVTERPFICSCMKHCRETWSRNSKCGPRAAPKMKIWSS